MILSGKKINKGINIMRGMSLRNKIKEIIFVCVGHCVVEIKYLPHIYIVQLYRNYNNGCNNVV